jgi:hypothetical protein
MFRMKSGLYSTDPPMEQMIHYWRRVIKVSDPDHDTKSHRVVRLVLALRILSWFEAMRRMNPINGARGKINAF